MSETPMNKLRAMCQTWWHRADSDCDPANGSAFAQGRGQGESTCAAELTAILPDVERLIEALRDANDKCRSAASIAQRDGKDTNWQAWRNQLGASLFKQQAALALFDQPVAPKETK